MPTNNIIYTLDGFNDFINKVKKRVVIMIM